jgi:catechol 2,3-dioxygenase-like lactoylglutathione lyase family enzyme
MKKPVFTDVLQIGIVVRDLDAAMKRYWEEFGLGPWAVNTLEPSNTSDMIIRGEPQAFALRAATTQIGSLQWELIQPLDDDSIYAEFLREQGEGLHHVGFGVEDYDEAMTFFLGRGMEVFLGGTWGTIESAYWDTRDSLGCIAEIWREPAEGEDFPEPDATYPELQASIR